MSTIAARERRPPPAPSPRRPRRREIGVVTSDKMNKTRRVEIDRLVPHPKYGKLIRRRTICKAHDEGNESHVGDIVEIMESRPLSKTKRWRITRIIRRGAQAALAGEGPPDRMEAAGLKGRMARSRLMAFRRGVEAQIRRDVERSKDPTSGSPKDLWVVKPKDWLHLYIRRVVASMTEEVRMRTLDEANAWKRQFNNRRLQLIRKQRIEGLSEPEEQELDRLQTEAEGYADFVFALSELPPANQSADGPSS